MNARRALRRLTGATLSVPLFWKILIANGAVVVGAALAGSALIGLAASLLVNAALVRTALRPLDQLQTAAARVRDGDLAARAADSPLADPAMRRLARVFNEALDALAASRRRGQLLLARSLEADERERRRVAVALEDDVAQRLAGLLLRLRLAERAPDPAALAAVVDEARAEVTAALEAVRAYAQGRRSAVLEELGLVEALKADARRLTRNVPLRIRVEGEEPRGLSGEMSRALYRVLSEAVGNAARHAGAHAIDVRLDRRGSDLVAVVEDDGHGFDAVAAENGFAEGLAAMRERTESAGGRFTVWSAPEGGSRVRVEVPLPAARAAAGRT